MISLYTCSLIFFCSLTSRRFATEHRLQYILLKIIQLKREFSEIDKTNIYASSTLKNIQFHDKLYVSKGLQCALTAITIVALWQLPHLGRRMCAL